MLFFKSKETDYYYYNLDRIVDFYFAKFFNYGLSYNLSIKKHENEIKNFIYKELECYEFKKGNKIIKKDKTPLGIKKLHSELGHLTGNWGFDWAWIMHHITYDFINLNIALSLIRESNNDCVLVYKYVPNVYYDFAEKIYIKDKNTREPMLFNLNKLFRNGHGLKEKPKKFKPLIGVTLWSGFSNEYWDLTELRKYDTNYYWDNEKKWFYLKPLKSKGEKLGITVHVGDKQYEV